MENEKVNEQSFKARIRMSEIQKKIVSNKDKGNKFFNYRQADDILNPLKKLMKAENGEVLQNSDTFETINGQTYAVSKVSFMIFDTAFHSTAMAKEDLNPANMSNPQCSGSAATYAYKRALGNLFAISDGVDDDVNHEKNLASKKSNAMNVNKPADFGGNVVKFGPKQIVGKTLNKIVQDGNKDLALGYFLSQKPNEYINKCIAWLRSV